MKKFRLVYKKDGHPCRVGDKIKTFRGSTGRLMSWRSPQTAASSGRVYVMLDERPRDTRNEFFPGVIGARFVEVEDNGR